VALKLNKKHIETIRNHGSREYPSECCGMLLGEAKGDVKEVVETVELTNLRHDPTRAQQLLPVADPGRETDRNRFLIDPLEQMRVEKDARVRGLDVLGYYHSHPDHPAHPSNYDREHAWPWYSYVIVSVARGAAKELASWVLAEDRAAFDAEQVQITGGT
jgi:proteasome lid subunit RPN8/RPN11